MQFMEIHFILDTNAYRQLTESKYLCELQPTASEMRKREAKVNSKSILIIVVTMELLKHFDKTDPFFMNCFKALTLQYFHTQTGNYGETKNNINFIPPLNTLLTQHFFNTNSDLFKYYLRIIEIAENATKNIEPFDFKKDKSDIEIIAQQLIFERTEVQQNIEDFIKSCNGDNVDWGFFRKIKVCKKYF